MLFLIKLVFGFVAILMGFSIHEFAHAAMAYRLGDPTQKYEGRLTLNPLVHTDWMGAAALLLSLIATQGRCIIGWGKPVAINAESLLLSTVAFVLSLARLPISFWPFVLVCR